MAVTASDVRTSTGLTVDEAAVDRARTIILTVAGVSDYAKTPAPWHVWLDRATVYQAAWMHERPDLFDEDNPEQIDLGDLRVRWRTGDELGGVLAPLAKSALERLEMLGTSSQASLESTRPGRTPHYGFPLPYPDDHGF